MKLETGDISIIHFSQQQSNANNKHFTAKNMKISSHKSNNLIDYIKLAGDKQ